MTNIKEDCAKIFAALEPAIAGTEIKRPHAGAKHHLRRWRITWECMSRRSTNFCETNEIALTYVQLHGRTIAFRRSEVDGYLSMREIRQDGSGQKEKAKKATVLAKASETRAKEIVGYRSLRVDDGQRGSEVF
jgi:hypothetical protein